MSALHESFPIRQCSGRLPQHPSRSACVLAEMGRCLSPCDGTASEDDYAVTVDALRRTLDASPEVVTAAIRARMARLAATERFEEATSHRNRMTSFIRAAARSQRLRALTGCAEIVAARRNDLGHWEVHVVRYGRLAAAGVIPSGVSARHWTDELSRGADTVVPGPGACARRDHRGVGEAAALARAAGRASRHRRRRLDVPGRRGGVTARVPRRDRDLPRGAGPVRHSSGQQHRGSAHPVALGRPTRPSISAGPTTSTSSRRSTTTWSTGLEGVATRPVATIVSDLRVRAHHGPGARRWPRLLSGAALAHRTRSTRGPRAAAARTGSRSKSRFADVDDEDPTRRPIGRRTCPSLRGQQVDRDRVGAERVEHDHVVAVRRSSSKPQASVPDDASSTSACESRR